MGLVILFVLLLLYILLAYFAARTWQVWHVVLLVFLFLFSFLFLILASSTLKVQDRWRSQYVAAQRDIQTERENYLRLTMGTLGGDEPGETELRGDIRRTLVDRGRIWRNLRVADLANGQVVLDASAWDEAGCRPAGSTSDESLAIEGDEETGEAAGDATDPAAAPAGQQPSIGLDADAVVFAFKEAPLGTLPGPIRAVLTRTVASEPVRGDASANDDTDEADAEESPAAGQVPPDEAEDAGGGEIDVDQDALLCKVPVYYMGEFKVSGDPNANPNSITLVPTMPLTEAQIEQLQDANSTWVLYEVMPADSHDVFAGLGAAQLAQLIVVSEMTAEDLRALIESYVRDLQQGTDTDPPERKWMTVKFTQPVSVDVDVDVATESGQQPLPDSVFDPSGRSQVATLNQGATTQFQEGDEATFDFATAQDLIGQGKAVEVMPIFHRRLRDYARVFRALTADMNDLSLQMDLAQTDLDKLTESIAQLQTQITFQTQQREFVTSDLAGLNTERDVLREYLGRLEPAWTDMLSELSRLYRTNRELVGRLASAC